MFNYLKSTLTLVFLRGGGFLGGYIFTLIITNNFGAYGQGVFATSYMLLLIFSMISKFGIDSSLVKFINDRDETLTNKQILILVNFISLILGLVFSALIFFMSEPLANLFSDENLVIHIKIAACSIPFFVFIDVNSTYLKAVRKPVYHSFFVQFIKMILASLVLYLLITFSSAQNLDLILKSYLLSLIAISFILVFVIQRNLSVGFKALGYEYYKLFNDGFKKNVLNIFKVSSPMLLSSGIVLLMGWMDIFILGIFQSTEDVGYYNVASKLAVAITFIYSSVASIELPSIAKLYSTKEISKLKENIKRSYKVILFLTIPGIMLLVIFGRQILGLFGSEFEAAYPVLVILMIGQSFNALSGFVGPLFQMTGLEVKLQNILIITCFINLLLNLLLVNIYDVIGVSIATSFSLIFWNLTGHIYLKKKIKILTVPRLW